MLLRNDSFSARRLASSSCVSSCSIELAEDSSSSTSWMGWSATGEGVSVEEGGGERDDNSHEGDSQEADS